MLQDHGCDGFNRRGSSKSSHGQFVLGIDRGFVETPTDASARWRTSAPAGEFVGNPAFNRDRGPASVLGVRFHLQF